MSLRWRRGGGIVQQAPPPAVFGPLQGRDAVIAGAGPLTVADPGGGISFNSSSSLQAAINANAAGSTFVCSVNVPVWNSTVNPGTKAPTIVFPGPVGQKVINGNGLQAFAVDSGPNTTIKGGTWQNFGSSGTMHCIRANDDLTLEDAVITGSWTNGIDIQGHRLVVRRCHIHANGINGFGGGGGGLFQADNLLFENNEINGNNTRQNNPGNTGGAFKILFSGHGTFRNNYVHDNIGFGMWWDTDNYDWLIENNVSEDNVFSGFFYEANWGSVIRNNLIQNNGKNQTVGGLAPDFTACVNVRLSDNAADTASPVGILPVQFLRNIVDHTDLTGNSLIFGGIILLWDHTDSSVRHVGNHDIFENQFWLRRTTQTGTIRNRDQDVSPVGQPSPTTNFQLWDLDNHFFSNEYHVASTTALYWRWGTGTGFGTDVNYSTWQGFHPGDNLPRIPI